MEAFGSMAQLQRIETETEHRDGAAALAAVSLLACEAGVQLRIERIPPELDCAQRLREIGIVEGAEVMVLRRSDPLLVLAKESRIAIDLETARRIEVSCG